MEIAEDRVHQLGVVGALLELDQARGERLEAVVALLEEGIDHVFVDGRSPGPIVLG